MKKLNVVIPVFALVLALLAGTFMTVLTTDFMRIYYGTTAPVYTLNQNGMEYNTIDSAKFPYEKTRYFAELRYKIEPNAVSLGRVMDVYEPETLLKQVKNGIAVPDDCYKKGIEYCEKLLTYNYEDFYNSENAVYPNDDMFKAFYTENYAFLLYLDGQHEKSIEVIDNYIYSVNTAYGMMGTVYLKSFFSYVYNEGDPNDKAWVLESEKFIIEKLKAYYPETDYSGRFDNEPIYYSFAKETQDTADNLAESTTGYYN